MLPKRMGFCYAASPNCLLLPWPLIVFHAMHADSFSFSFAVAVVLVFSEQKKSPDLHW